MTHRSQRRNASARPSAAGAQTVAQPGLLQARRQAALPSWRLCSQVPASAPSAMVLRATQRRSRAIITSRSSQSAGRPARRPTCCLLACLPACQHRSTTVVALGYGLAGYAKALTSHHHGRSSQSAGRPARRPTASPASTTVIALRDRARAVEGEKRAQRTDGRQGRRSTTRGFVSV
jgi:hypothetical protein